MKKKLSEKERTIHGQFMQYGQNVREWMEKCKRLLPLIDEYKIWEKKGFSSIHEYAGKLAGMGRSQVNDALWIHRKIEAFPLLAPVAERKGLNSVKPILGIITNGTQDFWAHKAESMTKNDLETYVREYRKRGFAMSEDEVGGQVGSVVGGNVGNGAVGGYIGSDVGNGACNGGLGNDNTYDNNFNCKSISLQVGGLPRKSDMGQQQVGEPPGKSDAGRQHGQLSEFSMDDENMWCAQRGQDQRGSDQHAMSVSQTQNRGAGRVRKLQEKIEKLQHSDFKLRLLENLVAELEELECEVIQTPPPVDSAELEQRLSEHEGGFSLEIKKPQPTATNSRYINAEMTRYIQWRSGSICEFHGCQSIAEEKHHAHRWAQNRVHNVDYIWNLCKNHHNLAHYGLIDREENGPESWRMRKHADLNRTKHTIDRQVQKYRQ